MKTESEFYIDWSKVVAMERDDIANDKTGGRIYGATLFFFGGWKFFIGGEWEDLKKRFDHARTVKQ